MRDQIRRLTLALSALAIMVMAPGLGAQGSEECQWCIGNCPANLELFCQQWCPEGEDFNAADCDDNQPECQGSDAIACYGFM